MGTILICTQTTCWQTCGLPTRRRHKTTKKKGWGEESKREGFPALLTPYWCLMVGVPSSGVSFPAESLPTGRQRTGLFQSHEKIGALYSNNRLMPLVAGCYELVGGGVHFPALTLSLWPKKEFPSQPGPGCGSFGFSVGPA